jgi:ferredoxin
MIKKLSIKNNNKYSFLPNNENISDISVYKTALESNFIFNENKVKSYCMNCKEQFCYTYDELNFSLGNLNGMPFNNSKFVCPTNSIFFNDLGANIDNNCINCGICYARCPIGAIKYSLIDNKYEVTLNNNKNYIQIPQLSLNDLKINITENHNELKQVTLSYNKNIKENEIIRNYLLAFKYEAKSYSIGNNDNRIDCIGFKNNRYLACEIKLNTNDYISLIRKALEDLALFTNKYHKKISDVDLVIFINQLPNKRSDFYELLKDVKTILKIQIYVVPIYFCDLFLKNGIKNFDYYLKYFNISSENLFISSGELDKKLKDIDCNYGLEGIYTPLK